MAQDSGCEAIRTVNRGCRPSAATGASERASPPCRLSRLLPDEAEFAFGFSPTPPCCEPFCDKARA